VTTPTITNLKATETDSSIAAAWGVSTEEGLGAIRVYLLAPGGQWEIVTDLAASARSYTYTKLSPATGYKIRVRPLVGGAAVELATTTLPTPPVTPPAPVLSVDGTVLVWGAIPGVTAYELAIIRNPAGARETTYQTVTGTSFQPPIAPGQTVSYGLAAHTPVGGPWAKEVSIAYPPVAPQVSWGVNVGAGWGQPQSTFLQEHGLWGDRVGATAPTMGQSLEQGFKAGEMIVVVGDTPDGTPLSAIDQGAWLQEALAQVREAQAAGVLACECGNEFNGKGGVANPQLAGAMFVALKTAMLKEGLTVPLLWYTAGDWYNPATGMWEQDVHGKGWNADAIAANPGLPGLIDGVSAHPYGKAHTTSNGDISPGGLENQLHILEGLGVKTDLYITEYGVKLSEAGSEAEQAAQLKASLEEFVGITNTKGEKLLRGFWYYEPRDDSNGNFGLLQGDDASVLTPRLALGVLAEFAA
jgi:hypothetical protein